MIVQTFGVASRSLVAPTCKKATPDTPDSGGELGTYKIPFANTAEHVLLHISIVSSYATNVTNFSRTSLVEPSQSRIIMLLSRTQAQPSDLSVTGESFQTACFLTYGTRLCPLAQQVEHSINSLATNISNPLQAQDESEKPLVESKQTSLEAKPRLGTAPPAAQPNKVGRPSLRRRKEHMFAVLVDTIDLRDHQSITSKPQICPDLASANERARNFASQKFPDRKLLDWGFYRETLRIDGSIQCVFSDERNHYRYVVKVVERWTNSD